ncbi:glycerophosphodiester phosphodiesterase family protein [Cryobacterium luteum]|uniref:glycerophosphodiester phosphodiesterase n=1 Tax=Cryobacterium luteum TaxID=1424661 RepID=A0A1H8KMZ9_9MICO|nr:glycerophosphodiester phosphodiesterase family protein [Cryobacterium luteum]TFB95080.1 glycerophosphodiester phosphodiesterase [Cryobacterium luteum]SEN93956.1 glycerophosphoryl diester phosphodiesterase [Cryobacterium luteum]
MPPLVIGHRGASGYRPEHTAFAYDLAFELGADAVEPDIVATRDGILVLRHENDISVTTDVASRAEFAGRRTTKEFLGHTVAGWFTEDFTWAELATLRARERLAHLRPKSARHDDQHPILRLSDLFDLVDAASNRHRRTLGMVAEIKSAAYFTSIGLPLDELFAAEVRAAGWNGNDGRLIIESFEPTVLDQIAARGIIARNVFLIAPAGQSLDKIVELGAAAPYYADHLTKAGLAALGDSSTLHGISVDKSLIIEANSDGELVTSTLVADAHAAGLQIFCWTLRPENAFLTEPHRRGELAATFGHWRGEFAAVMASGIDGVFVDHPDLAVSVRDDLRSRVAASV